MIKKEKHFGQVFTPKYLVEDILDIAGYRADASILCKHIIDNSCGDGAFLEEIVRRYCAAYLQTKKDKVALSRQLGRFIHGIEVDADAHAKCLERLDALAYELAIPYVKWDVRNADTLAIEDYNGKMDFVVGNPPYVRVHNLAENFLKVKAFRFCGGGMTDLYLVFYEIGLRMLSPAGKLCYIAPSSWINSMAGHNMREYLMASHCLRCIVDLGHYQPFEAMTYTAIAVLGRDTCDSFRYCVYDGPKKIRHIADLGYADAFFDDALYLGTKRMLANFRKVKVAETPQYVEVKNGFATLADDVFIADSFPFSQYVIPVIKASTGKWRKAFFPYDMNGKPLSRSTIFSDKKISTYLESRKDELLKEKPESACPEWYLFGRTQALKDVGANKYAVNTCIRDVGSIKFNNVPAGSGVYSGLYVLTDIPGRIVRAALVSKGFVLYVSLLKKYKSGGYYTFNSRELEQYLNCAIDKMMTSEEREEWLSRHGFVI